MHTTDVRNTFGDDLRRWRERQGISQLELSVRAETTQRHVSYLERGRSQPSRTMVVRLAEAMGMALRDRNALLLSSGYAPLFPETDFDGPALRPVREAVDRVLAGHEPYPALVARPDGEVVAANAALDLLTEGAAPELVQPPFNGYRLALHPDGLAPRIINFDDWAVHVLDALRAALRHRPDERLAALLEELEGYVPEPTPGPDHLGFAVPLRLAHDGGELTLITTLTTFATALDVTLAELRLEAFLPADEHTAAVLRARLEVRAS